MKNHFRKVFFLSQYFSNIEKFSKENIFFRNRKRFSESFRYLGVRMLVFRNTILPIMIKIIIDKNKYKYLNNKINGMDKFSFNDSIHFAALPFAKSSAIGCT